MSLERKERRRCNLCGEVISGEYYSCERKYHTATDGYIAVGTSPVWTGTINGYGYTCQPVPAIDVCLDCWEKMDKK